MWRSITVLSIFFCAAITAIYNPPSANAAESTQLTPRLVASRQAVSPGETLKVGVLFAIPSGNHIYYRQAGDSGRPTKIEFILPDGSSASALLWPKPLRIESEGLVCYGYHNQTVISAEITVPSQTTDSHFLIRSRVSWLVCGNGSCLPGQSELLLDLPVVANQALAADSPEACMFNYPAFTGSLAELSSDTTGSVIPETKASIPTNSESLSLPYALLLSFAAGLLLNLMPCVLPVLALKVLSLAKQAGQDRAASLRLGLAYTLGTLATFAAMATAMVSARALGSSLGWGFQFQSIGYLVGMCSIICLMTLSLFGLFFVQIQTGVQSLESVASRNGLLSAFARGISATLLSTPCSAPLLGTALGFALSQSGLWIFAVLSMVGFGLAFPYLLLSCFPSFLSFVPKPGEWMERFKEAMGFLMLATLVWMLSVIATVGGSAALVGTLSFLFCLSFAAWFYVRFSTDGADWLRKLIVSALSISLVGFSFYHHVWTLPAKGSQIHISLQLQGVTVEPYSEEALKQHLAEGKVVLVDATAEWCLTCKLNERVLSSSSVQEAMRKHQVVVLEADWTSGDAKVGALIKSFSRPGVPMYVIYSPHGKKPLLLPEIISPGIVTDAIREAAAR